MLDFNFMLMSTISEGRLTEATPSSPTWIKAPLCTLKINVDGSWVKDGNTGRVGYLIRDSSGVCGDLNLCEHCICLGG